MNKLYFHLMVALCLTGYNAQSTILTVDNSIAGAAQYTTMQAAIDAASNGDTILVQPSGISYGNFTLNKRLVVIGAGFSPINGTAPPTIFGTVSLDGSESHSTTFPFEIIGADIGQISKGSGSVLFMITFRRCRFTTMSANSIKQSLFEGCFFNPGSSISVLNFAWEDIVYRNCVFINSNTSFAMQLSIAFGAISASFEHCIFYNALSSASSFNIFTANTSLSFNFINCIFEGRYNYNTTNAGYNHCLIDNTVGSGHEAKLSFLNANTTVPNSNIMGNPSFTAYTPPSTLSPSSRFMLGPGSAATGTGFAGQDIGVHGGAATYSYGGMPSVPTIILAMLLGTTNPADQSIEIFINAIIQQ